TGFLHGGAGSTIAFATGRSSLGAILVARSERGICAILLGDDAAALERELREQFPQATLTRGDRAFAQNLDEVIALVDQPGHTFDLPLDIRGTAFQERVWQALREIPAGETITYSALA